MSSESTQPKINLVEGLAILIFIVGIVFVFISKNSQDDGMREIHNAKRFADVSLLADALWKLSIESPDFSDRASGFVSDLPCDQKGFSIDLVSDLLVPSYLSSLPIDPNGESYLFSLDIANLITVCSPWGEGETGEPQIISITR